MLFLKICDFSNVLQKKATVNSTL